MKVMIGYPPLKSPKGTPLLGQNRQFQWFHNPSFIYPMIPAYAATLLKEAGYEVVWADGIAETWDYETFIEAVSREAPRLIALETKTPVVKLHWKIIDDLKGRFPGLQVALMGDHVTALPQESLERSSVDFVLTGGDYDFLLLSLANHLSRGTPLDQGIWYREDGGIATSGPFSGHYKLHELPLIDRDLTRWHLYGEHLFKRRPGSYTMVGRDCWYAKCAFCSWTTLYPRFRTRGPDSLVEEIRLLIERYGVREIMEDTGTLPVGGWLKTFCRGMIRGGFHKRILIDCNMRVGALKREQYELMKEAGFRVLKFGIESANNRTLELLNKGATKEQAEDACRMASKAGLEVHLTTMVGYPWETWDDARRTVDFAKELFAKGYAHMLQATVVIPYPGTPLFEEARRQGWLRTLDWDCYDMREPVLATPVSDERLMELTRDLYSSFLSPRFVARKLLSVRSVDDARFLLNAGRAVLGHLRDFAANDRRRSPSGDGILEGNAPDLATRRQA